MDRQFCKHHVTVGFYCPVCKMDEDEHIKYQAWLDKRPPAPEGRRTFMQQKNNTDIATEITRLQDLLATPNLNQQTIDEINVNLQELLRMQRQPQTACQHVKKYADHVLLSNPQRYPWKCELCGEEGKDLQKNAQVFQD